MEHIREGDIIKTPEGDKTLEPGGTIVPLSPDADSIGAKVVDGSEVFDPEVPTVIDTTTANEALTEPQEIPAEIEASMTQPQTGEVFREQGEDTVFIRIGDEIRGFTTEQALINAGFQPGDETIIAAGLLADFEVGRPINEIVANSTPFLVDAAAIDLALGVGEEQEDVDEATQKIIDFLTGLPEERKKAREEAFDEFGVQDAEDEIAEIDKKIIEFEKNTGLAEEFLRNEPGVIASIISGNVGRLSRAANIQRTALFAQKAAIEGEFQRALALAKESISDANDASQFQLQAMQIALTKEAADLTGAQASAAQALVFQIQERQNQLQREQKLADEKAALFTDLSVAYPTADIRPGMTINEMFAAVQEQATAEENLELRALELDIALKLKSLNTPVGGDNAQKLINIDVGDGTSIQLTPFEYAASVGDQLLSEKTGEYVDWNVYLGAVSNVVAVAQDGLTSTERKEIMDPRKFLSPDDLTKFGLANISSEDAMVAVLERILGQ